MARQLERLSARKVAGALKPGYHPDGAGLYLQVSQAGTKSWILRYVLNGKAREMGLGSLHDFSLAEARERARGARQLVADGHDPIESRRAARAGRALNEAKTITFEGAAKAYVKAHGAKWTNPKHATQWLTGLQAHAYPVLGALPVANIDTGLVMRVLEPLWREIPDTASRLRGRIENVLHWATVMGYRSGENPARWKGHIQVLLPPRAKVTAVEHHAALDYRAMHDFLPVLRQQAGMAPRALEFTILVAARTNETRGARWSEFDLDEATWTVPAARMKGRVEHRVPLSGAALKLLRSLPHSSEFVFPGKIAGRSLSQNAMMEVLLRMGRSETVHGFRSSFRDWASERTSYPREVIEMSLAHAIGDKVEAAYRRGDLFDKRRKLMAEWARHCDAPKVAKVVRIAAA